MPLSIGVFGGSFNPIHLGHALLAITVQQTKDSIDQVVLVPVYKHAVKTNLLPFEDRVNMCRLAVQNFEHVHVSTIEQQVGASNGEMLQGLRLQYPPDTKFYWICGDDFFQWWDKPKGRETLDQVHGLIVQRRLHRTDDATHFYKEPIDEQKITNMALSMNLTIDYIYGELPHFSSTLVRRAPGSWRSFLTSSVASYLDQRPNLLQQLMENLESDAQDEEKQQQQQEKTVKLHQRSPSVMHSYTSATSIVMQGLEAVHFLQRERGCTALFLSQSSEERLNKAQQETNQVIQNIVADSPELDDGFDEARALAAELKRIPIWLEMDRKILQKHKSEPNHKDPEEAWMQHLDLVEKFDTRIDVLIGGTVRALTEILRISSDKQSKAMDRTIPELFKKWCEGKEALGRERAFVCSGGPIVPELIRKSYKLRERLIQTIDLKERRLARVLSLEAGLPSKVAAPKALHNLLEQLTRLEYTTMGCFSASTPLPIVHHILEKPVNEFDVVQFFNASTAPIDFLLSFAKALAASACASA